MNGIDELFIVDDEYTGSYAQYLEYAVKAQELWNQYIKLSEQIVVDQKIIEGNRANSYAGFIEVVKEMIGSEIETIMTKASADMSAYIDNIDQADQCLY